MVKLITGKLRSLRIALCLLILTTSFKAKKIKLLVQLAHFGASSPARIYHNEKSEKYDWIKNNGIEELTPVGRRQMYLLGLQTKRNYSSLFEPPFDLNQLYVRVPGKNITYHSAQVIVSAIFKDIFRRQPLVFKENDIKVKPPYKIDNDIINIGTEDPVPNGPEMITIVRKSRYYDEVMQLGLTLKCPSLDVTNLAEKLGIELQKKSDTNFTKKIIEDLDLKIEKDGLLISCFKLSIFVYVNYFSNPKWDSDVIPGTELWDKLTRCYQVTSVALMGDENTMLITGTPLLIRIKEIIEERLNFLKVKKEYKGLKYALFVGSDPNLEKTLLLLGLFDRECIIKQFLNDKSENCLNSGGYGTVLNFELFYDDESKQGEINIRYKGRSRNVCGNKEFLDKIGLSSIANKYEEKYSKLGDVKEYYCDIEDFMKILDKRIVKDWQKKCGISLNNDQNIVIYSSNLMVVLALADIIMLTVIFILYKMKRKKKKFSRSKSLSSGNSGDEVYESDAGEYYGDNDYGYKSFDLDDSQYSNSLGSNFSMKRNNITEIFE